MPIYEYGCLACGAEFEKLVQAPTAVACPSCRSDRVSRRLSIVGVKVGARASSGPAAPMGGGGGCCGGGCGCH
ncbi:MAG TPA: zinc ribbon domain-containing protein [Methylomirabilota bacterium]|jgi:putative FmdB family regulatory protein|nr:zinc ribbon domain-containing protein [Methylomirabilota bacterium]